MSHVKVRYIGKKSLKRDTVTLSLAVWSGFDSVTEVSEEVAAQLCRFPDVWQLANKPLVERPVVLAVVEDDSDDDDDEPEDVDTDDVSGVIEEFPPVTTGEIVEIIPSLNRETDFTDAGRPIIGKLRERFEGREITTVVVKDAWKTFQGE
jgi:hypothetical protein